MIYEPAEDSFLLNEEVRKYSPDKSVLDMGSASGILIKTAIKSGAKSVLAVDIQEEVIKHLKKQKINAIQSDLFSNINEKFDLIIFNPPYLPNDEREDKESSIITSGGKKGDEILVRFFNQVLKHLNPKGIVLIVLSSLTPKKKILETLEKNSLKKRKISERKIFQETLEVWEISRKS